MGSLVKSYKQQKLQGQIYTPEFIVKKILNDVGYTNFKILGKDIIDPACGDGRFLIEIVRRIVEHSSEDKLVENLSKVHGWDIDPTAVAHCRSNLNQIIEHLGLAIDWNVRVCNSLHLLSESSLKGRFDFVIGNPPYIRIQHLDVVTREFIQQNFAFCKKGSTDCYVAFFELALHLMSNDGICGFITPNTYFYTATSKLMRDKLVSAGFVKQLTNYGSIQIFDNVSTYSAITIITKVYHQDFTFEDAYTKYDFISQQVEIANIDGRIWQLSNSKSADLQGIPLKQISKIHVGLTTLCDKAYFFPTKPYKDDLVIANTKLKGEVKLEAAIVRPLIKASKYRGNDQDITEYALFPYQWAESAYRIIPESKLKSEFPLAYSYLLDIKQDLDKRDNGKVNSVAWYAYGRNQGINLPRGEKILFSPMNKYPNFLRCAIEDALFYSGYCLLYFGDTNDLLEQLNSDKMANYISMSSRDFRGGWKAYNKQIVQDFTVAI